jgi:hypothetical protein
MVWGGTGMTAENFQDIITFSRATGNATYYNSSGYLTTAGVWNYLTYSNVFDNAAWTKSASFIQTNLLLQSQTFNDAAWVKNQAGVAVVPVVTADQGTAPDGTLTADRIQLNCVNNTSATNRCFISPLSISYPSGSNYTASIYVKAFDASNVGKTIRFAVDGLNSIIYTLTANWQRITMTGLASTTVVNFLIETRGTYTDQTADLLMWGAQLVQGSVPGDYRATTTAALPILYPDWTGEQGEEFIRAAIVQALAEMHGSVVNVLAEPTSEGLDREFVIGRTAELAELSANVRVSTIAPNLLDSTSRYRGADADEFLAALNAHEQSVRPRPTLDDVAAAVFYMASQLLSGVTLGADDIPPLLRR